MRPRPFAPRARVALVVAHPGHELRLFHWLHLTRPVVSVLTDGSGAAGVSRIGSTTRILDAAGARPGSLYAALSDRRVYQAILAGDEDFFRERLEVLAEGLAAEAIDDVVFDAAEGFNPVHDLCNLLAAAAARRASKHRGLPVRAWDFPLEGRPDACAPALLPRAVTWRLGPLELRRKLDAISGYEELSGEATRALAQLGREAFAIERVRPATRGRLDPSPCGTPPDYESHGRDRVDSGRYAAVIRYAEHVRPIADAIDALVASPA